MAVSSIAAFWAVAALLIAVPGADWAYVIGTVLAGRPVVLAVGGLVIGYAAVTAAVAAGVGALVARTPASLTALTVAGGVYLIWLGVRASTRTAGHGIPAQPAAPAGPPEIPTGAPGARAEPPGAPTGPPGARTGPPGAPAGPAAGSGRGTLARGIGVSGLNPKGLLVFLALLPQFTNPRGGWPLTVQLAVLGLVFTVTCALFYLSMGSLIRRILAARPGVARAISRVSGAAMIVIGLLLLVERIAA
jgi:threonine/homoserine/homoserine lactone efflux protein